MTEIEFTGVFNINPSRPYGGLEPLEYDDNVIKHCPSLHSINNKESEEVMLSEKGMVKVAIIDNGKLIIREKLQEIMEIDKRGRKVKTSEGLVENVISLKMAEGSLLEGFTNKEPKVKIIDTRAMWVELQIIKNKAHAGLITKLDFDVQVAEFKQKYGDVSGTVEHKLVWDDANEN